MADDLFGTVEGRIAESLADYHRRVDAQRLGALTPEDRERANREAVERNNRSILDEYRRLGLEPRYSKEGQPISVALARRMYLIRGAGDGQG